MIVAIVQARVTSTRLPEKVLRPILGQPMLFRQLERVRRSRQIDKLLVATSSDRSDDPLKEVCAHASAVLFRGSLDDVLDRFFQAAKLFCATHVVRLTGDCPLADPDLIDRVVAYYLENELDYCANDMPPSFPDGLDVEVLRFECLESAWREAILPSQREHVTPFIYQHPQRFKTGNYEHDQDLSHLRWTVDELVDFELIDEIYKNLYLANPHFNTQDVLNFLDLYPELKTINTAHQRNEGFAKSLLEDVGYEQGNGQ